MAIFRWGPPSLGKNRHFSTNIWLWWSIGYNTYSGGVCWSRETDDVRSATHQWILFVTESLDVRPKTTEQNLIVCSGKSEAEVTSKKRLRSRYCTVEANYREAQSIARPLCNSRASFILWHSLPGIQMNSQKPVHHMKPFSLTGYSRCWVPLRD